MILYFGGLKLMELKNLEDISPKELLFLKKGNKKLLELYKKYQ